MPMFMDGASQVLQQVLQTVLVTSEPAIVIPGSFLGELDVIVDEAKNHGMKLVSIPKGGITILPPIPMSESSLTRLCKDYYGLKTDAERLALFSNLEETFPTAPGVSLPCRLLYHPRDYICRIVHLCAELVTASDEEYQKAYDIVPLLHIRPVQNVCEELRRQFRAGALTQRLPLGQRVDVQFKRTVVHLDGSMDPFPRNAAEAAVNIAPVALDAVDDIYEGFDVTGTEVVDIPTGKVSEYLSEKDFELVTEDSVLLDPTGKRVQAIFIRGGIDKDICRRAAADVEGVATKQNMRRLTNGGVRNPDTGILGYYDYLNNPTKRKCRMTEFTRRNWGKIIGPCGELLQLLDQLYKENAPDHYELQRRVIPPEYMLFNTVFSTVSVNKNFRTAVHRDKGDFRGGLTALCVLDGNYEGCYLALKSARKAFCLQVGDVLFFDSSLEHGNTEVHNREGSWRRISIVCYLRCGLMSHTCETERSMRLRNQIMSDRLHADSADSVVNLNGVTGHLPPLCIPFKIAKTLSLTQHAALRFVSRRIKEGDGCVLALTMGLGKTLVSLTICYSYIYNNGPCDILIVAPKTLLQHWMQEAKKWKDYGLVFPGFIVLNNVDSSSFEDDLSNYEQQGTTTNPKKSYVFVINPGYIKSFLSRVKGFRPALIVVDEGHCISSKESKLREVLDSLYCSARVVLTGTPVQNNAEELYRLVGWVDDKVHSTLPQRDFNEFSNSINRYVNGDDSAFCDALFAQRYIHEWMSPYVFTVMKVDLPPLHDYIIICNFSAVQQKMFEERIKVDATDNLLCLKASEHRPYHLSTHPLCFLGFLTGIWRTGQVDIEEEPGEFEELGTYRLSRDDDALAKDCSSLLENGKLADFVALSGKLTALISILHSIFEKMEKAVIFSQYIGSQDFIARTLTAYKISVVTIRGKDCQQRRRRVVEMFRDDKNVLCLVVSTQIGAYGLDLTAANHVILWDTWWNPQVESQAIARCYRQNQSKAVIAYKLASGFEDATVLKAQARKRALFKCLINEETSQVVPGHDLVDYTSSEEDDDRRHLWETLKTCTLEGGKPAVTKIIRNIDTVKSERWI
ncbi:SNF2 DNA repair protein, putative [Trypanosoma equiperdum]|uniref:Thymine dioxygenase JBP2 n=3 Tax=Trypanozoon TaxID=39700 RepID=JBP2_TRYB2|nr:SNF2 DNA repair protein, putative [Trypanosoma brucei brucei TREU927]Q57X81.1 RecName: Full=Bifunctional helicase and thymine dioxygenase JBP2; AltName: Full=J-binding protein 2; Short=TbJBP2; Includes: RecName: Full=Probable DNA helicase JBP2; Includes: RecName: Full=Thymine dioxygenase JBP2 [Trypanosoma brucei brucei TREU927]AAX69788.1 SNF2 DNA repair protein, putative [Trypanosoma brucei]AAZ12529.1 SNF2 DNA repair protein, putative [Trypanosoma brucei brucei TREU927]SCU72345.1 SNF2 DNA re